MPILVGILPLRNYRNAEFLSNEVPGMKVPDSILQAALGRGVSGGCTPRAGIDIAREALLECVPMCQGVYVMPPFNSAKAALQVLEALPESVRSAKSRRLAAPRC